MNTMDISSFEQELKAKKNEAIARLNKQLQDIDLSQPPRLETVSSQPATQPPTGKYLLLGGGILFVVGLISKWSVLTWGGVALAAAGIYITSKQKQATPAPLPAPVDFPKISRTVYRQLENIHTSISQDWDDFLVKQKEAVRATLQTSDLDEEKKNEAIKETLNRSIVQYSMAEVLSRLSAAEKLQNIESYSQYLKTFQAEYQTAIESAYREQNQRYEKIAAIIKM